MNINVLYVDDELLNLMSFEMLFKNKFNVYTASNAYEALEKINKIDFKVVIADQKMPNMNGVEFLTKVQNKKSDTLRIIHSGYIDDNEILSALNNNIAQYFLDKPLNDAKLLEIIHNYYTKNKNNYI